MTLVAQYGRVFLVLLLFWIFFWYLKFSRNPLLANQMRAENVKSSQLTTAERLYILGVDGSSRSIIKFDKYLQHVASHIDKPAESAPHGSRMLDPNTLKFQDAIDKVLDRRHNGFFVECGAADGFYSQTQFLELNRNWTGLLVEANQRYLKELLKLNRKAYVFGGCLTPYHPKQVQFLAGGGHGFSDELQTEYFKNMLHRNVHKEDSNYLVQCFPLNHILASIGVNHVDFFSLDIQGGEPKILEAIDYNTLRIDVILVEVENVNSTAKEILRNDMRALFHKTGLYDEAATLDNDMIFKRKDMQHNTIRT